LVELIFARAEFSGVAIVAVAENVIVVENEIHVMEQIDNHRRVRDGPAAEPACCPRLKVLRQAFKGGPRMRRPSTHICLAPPGFTNALSPSPLRM